MALACSYLLCDAPTAYGLMMMMMMMMKLMMTVQCSVHRWHAHNYTGSIVRAAGISYFCIAAGPLYIVVQSCTLSVSRFLLVTFYIMVHILLLCENHMRPCTSISSALHAWIDLRMNT